MTKEVVINTEAVEPSQYFSVLKDSSKDASTDMLQKQLDVIAAHLINAKAVGQKNLVDKLAFTHDVIIREMKLLTSGFDKFVYQDDIKNLLDKTKNIKIIELERFQRVIPLDKMEILKKAKELGLFDDFCVVFSDYTDQDYASEEDKKTIDRNRDPIIFGLFRNEKSGLRAERFYFICDWEDEYCDLTFGKMIAKMADIGINKPRHIISTDEAYITELVRSTLDEMNTKSNISIMASVQVQNKSYWKRLKSWLTGGQK